MGLTVRQGIALGIHQKGLKIFPGVGLRLRLHHTQPKFPDQITVFVELLDDLAVFADLHLYLFCHFRLLKEIHGYHLCFCDISENRPLGRSGRPG